MNSEWRLEAACLGLDPDLFFPQGESDIYIKEINAAKAICNMCVVREKCLEYALTTNQNEGIWGGATWEERKRIKRQRSEHKIA